MFEIYEIDTGRIRSITSVVPDPLPDGFAVREHTPPKQSVPRMIWTRDFKRRFTSAERIAMRNSTDDVVVDFIDLLNSSDRIDLDHRETIDGVGYMTSVGLIRPERVSEVLN